jgi:hypothetical protein
MKKIIGIFILLFVFSFGFASAETATSTATSTDSRVITKFTADILDGNYDFSRLKIGYDVSSSTDDVGIKLYVNCSGLDFDIENSRGDSVCGEWIVLEKYEDDISFYYKNDTGERQDVVLTLDYYEYGGDLIERKSGTVRLPSSDSSDDDDDDDDYTYEY